MPNEFCVLRNKPLHSFCPFIRVNMAEEELTRCVVDNDSGKCKARSVGDEALCDDNDSGKAGFPRDDAPRAVPSNARHGGWYAPEGRKIWHHIIYNGLRVAPEEYRLETWSHAITKSTMRSTASAFDRIFQEAQQYR